MKLEVRRAALRAAFKTALVMTVGCAGSAHPATENTGGSAAEAGSAAAPSCGTYLDGLATAKPVDLPDGDPLKGRMDVFGAFTDPAARVAARTQECCTKELDTVDANTPHRWACCSALDNKSGACTPWGPPCPPEMA
jgi:hypothetical protein